MFFIFFSSTIRQILLFSEVRTLKFLKFFHSSLTNNKTEISISNLQYHSSSPDAYRIASCDDVA